MFNSLPISMTQPMDTDIKELKDPILGLDKKIDELKTDIEVMDNRLSNVEKGLGELKTEFKASSDKLDNRLRTFGGIILTAALGIIVKLLAFPNA
jgi:peptidoglycan hydrolase CwlO-like protein